CHTANPTKFLAGGVPFPIPIPSGMVQGRNLTPDPVTGMKLSEAQFLEVMRAGADFLNSGQGLIVHPWQSERWTAVADFKAVYAYLRAIPAIVNQIPADVKPPVTQSAFPANYNEGEITRDLPPESPDPDHVLRGLAMLPLNIPEPADAQNAALFGRGSYIVNGPAACSACHTNPERNFASANLTINAAQYLAGGTIFPIDPAVQPIFRMTRAMTGNLTGATHGFFAQPGVTFQTFLITMMQGVAGDEPPPRRPLAPIMPSHIYRNMTLGDLQAVYTYLKWIATTAPRSGANDKPTQTPTRYCTQLSDCVKPGEACNTTLHECAGTSCVTAKDCDACQTCTGSVCTVPASNSPCLTTGL
ncbi:MAG: Cytochrome c, class, partial [Myxococcaceae bacterium]|nr:Cytochrome c, class [Myxococcaceae bacterium]